MHISMVHSNPVEFDVTVKITNTTTIMLSLRHESNIPNTINIKTVRIFTTENEKKALGRDANTAPAVVKQSQNFSPRRRPLPGGAGRPKFNQLKTVTTFTYKPSLVRIDARNFELSW